MVSFAFINMILFIATVILLVIYAVLILYYRAGWKQAVVFEPEDYQPGIRISVVIAARNEEDNIGDLLSSLEKQTYPHSLYEVIVVNDHSTDRTEEIVREYPAVKLVNLTESGINSYKKKAIEKGIETASGELIVVTDADCLAPPEWLNTIAAFRKTSRAVMIAAPVKLVSGHSLFQQFQALDFLVLQGITAASMHKKFHIMGNGANLAYDRAEFYEAGGFHGIDSIASGDDMLLMQKIAALHPGGIAYLLSEKAIVSSRPARSWKEFFNQRIRWASKATSYRDKKITWVLMVVYFFNLSLLLLLIAGCWNPVWWKGLALVLVFKITVEYFFVREVASFYKSQSLVSLLVLFQPLHILYTVVAGWLGSFGHYTWKGRRVK